MRVVVYGAGELAEAFRDSYHGMDVELVTKGQVDVRDFHQVVRHLDARVHRVDFVICTAGLSDRVIGTHMAEILDVNLKGPMYVAASAAAFDLPCLLLASTAGMVASEHHPAYGPAKAGVIAYVKAAALRGQKIWALSPNRMDTRMRSADWPDEDPATRLSPRQHVVPVMWDIIDGKYAPGANVVVRKVGKSGRVDVYEEGTWTLPSLLD